MKDDKESVQKLAQFGSLILDELIQGDWEPDFDWLDRMLKLAEDRGLIKDRPVQEGDDVPEEYDFVWERLV